MKPATFEDAVEQLAVAAREYMRPDIGCFCPVKPPTLCYKCSWKKNLLAAASEVALFEHT